VCVCVCVCVCGEEEEGAGNTKGGHRADGPQGSGAGRARPQAPLGTILRACAPGPQGLCNCSGTCHSLRSCHSVLPGLPGGPFLPCNMNPEGENSPAGPGHRRGIPTSLPALLPLVLPRLGSARAGRPAARALAQGPTLLSMCRRLSPSACSSPGAPCAAECRGCSPRACCACACAWCWLSIARLQRRQRHVGGRTRLERQVLNATVHAAHGACPPHATPVNQ